MRTATPNLSRRSRAAIYAATRPGRNWLPRVHYPVGRQTRVLAGLAQIAPNRLQRLLNKAVTGT